MLTQCHSPPGTGCPCKFTPRSDYAMFTEKNQEIHLVSTFVSLKKNMTAQFRFAKLNLNNTRFLEQCPFGESRAVSPESTAPHLEKNKLSRSAQTPSGAVLEA